MKPIIQFGTFFASETTTKSPSKKPTWKYTHLHFVFTINEPSNGCNSESVTMWFQDQHRQLKKNATSDIRARAYIHTHAPKPDDILRHLQLKYFIVPNDHCFFFLLRCNWGVLSRRASIFSLCLHQSAIASWLKHFISKINCIFQLLWLSLMPEIESNLALTR